MSTLIHADELEVGSVWPLGSHTPTEAEIIEFARRWDPQRFHTDPAYAADHFFGGIIASGIHTMAIFQRLAVPAVFDRWATIAGRGMEDVRLLRPVRPDEKLTGSITVDAVDLHRPDRATVSLTGRLESPDGAVLTMALEIAARRRAATEE
ncbi:MaoC/PaaZ C-terminal domain-containing protein [Williamsia herbipolensis]|uniref:MaoC/PaaZ C-terminal domain-containing protein n=1 Tax=Williamsia herbipolensis TaxID=1603258 RepID=UPI0005F7AF20|nr:MaoC/PaaZ C-terminal domain-containing protein [Williamsia herbipolensis]